MDEKESRITGWIFILISFLAGFVIGGDRVAVIPAWLLILIGVLGGVGLYDGFKYLRWFFLMLKIKLDEVKKTGD
jgi:hypothetical protein